MYLANFRITGFNCPACVKLSTLELEAIDGVNEVRIAEDGRCQIKSTRQIELEEFKSKLKKNGFDVTK